MTEAAKIISTIRFGNCRGRKGFFAEEHIRCRAGVFWDCAEYARNCHPLLDGEQTWAAVN